MKRQNNLYKFVCDFNNIVDMTDKVCSRVRNKRKVNIFETYKSEHIYNIYRRLNTKNLDVGEYNIFMITDPKCRIVMAQNIEDKIINHLIAEYVLVKVFETKYIDSMCATRKDKGTLFGIKLLKKYINNLKRYYKDFYVLKLDIKKYFYNVDHNILKKILFKKIKDKDALNILYSIIDSTNNTLVNSKINKLKNDRINYLKKSKLTDKECLIEEVKNIPLYEYEKGIALGNQTSQAFGLIYLNEFNHYLKEKLHLKYVINYMDDFIILHHNKRYLNECLDKIIIILNYSYKLTINIKKTKINHINNGIDFLGYRFLIKNNKLIMRLRKRTKKRFKNKVKKVNNLFIFNKINKKEYDIMISSYNGLLKWGSCTNLYYKWIKGVFMLEKYYKYKIDYSEYIVFIRVGNFYECFNNDAFILNSIFNYKPKRIKNAFKAGFPVSGIDEVIKRFEEIGLFYIIVDDGIIKEYANGKNRYNDYNYNFDVINYNYLRIEKINNFLYDNMLNENVSDVLSKIENVIVE